MFTIYAIKDLKNPFYGIPMFHRSPQDMRRSICMQMIRDPEALAARFPSDYEVWAIGEWDEEKGDITLFQNKEAVCSMLEIHQLAKAAGREDVRGVK